jgi:hypothetical protein
MSKTRSLGSLFFFPLFYENKVDSVLVPGIKPPVVLIYTFSCYPKSNYYPLFSGLAGDRCESTAARYCISSAVLGPIPELRFCITHLFSSAEVEGPSS